MSRRGRVRNWLVELKLIEYAVACSKLCSQKVSVTADVQLLAGRACDRQDC